MFIELPDGGVAHVSVGNEPVAIKSRGRTYLFEWTRGCGWLCLRRDGEASERLHPQHAWDALEKMQAGDGDT